MKRRNSEKECCCFHCSLQDGNSVCLNETKQNKIIAKKKFECFFFFVKLFDFCKKKLDCSNSEKSSEYMEIDSRKQILVDNFFFSVIIKIRLKAFSFNRLNNKEKQVEKKGNQMSSNEQQQQQQQQQYFKDEQEIDQYRKDWEIEDHWQMRKNFMLAHYDHIAKDRLLCYAQLYVNIEVLQNE